MRRFIPRSACPTLAVILVGLTTIVSPLSAQELTPAEAQTIAKRAYIYGFPLVENYKTMYAHAIDDGGEPYQAPLNTLRNEASVITPANTAIVTPNCDTPRSFLWLDLRTEPLVLGVPEFEKDRYYAIQLVDLYTFNFDYIGSRTTGNAAGQYLIAGPKWQGETPPGVAKVIRSQTEFVMALYRTQLFRPDDLEKVRSIQNQYTVRTLSDFMGEPPPTPAPSIDFPTIDPKSEVGLAFFGYLNFLLQFCPTDPSETEFMASLGKIGVGPGKTFDATSFSDEIQVALKSGIAEAETDIASGVLTVHSAEVYGTRAFLKGDFLKRALAAKIRLYGNSKEEALSPLYLTDAEGKPLDGSKNNYVLKMTSEELPPVNAFWSVTMYDAGSQALASNPINRYLINTDMLDQLQRDADGSLTLTIQHPSPGDENETNWLPAPNGPFYLVMRLYWPKAEAFDGTWRAPLVWPETVAPEQPTAVPAGAEVTQQVKSAVMVEEPKPEMERPTIWGEPTEVEIAIYIIDVDEVSSAQQNFAASVYYQARWKNPFLRHKGPGPMHRGVTEVWTPRLTIIGQQNVWRAFPESVEIQPDGEVVYRQKMWGRFSQPLDLRDFPLDQQELTIHVVAAGLFEEHVKMVPLKTDNVVASDIAAKFSVPDFDVLSWQAEPLPYHAHRGGPGTAGFHMKITVARSATYFVLKVIVPLCLIVIMSWLPRWIDPDQIGTNVGISTTSFLTLVAYLFAINVLLPRVSYVTRMDRFILLSTVLVFASLMHTVANTSLIRNRKKATVERIDRWSRAIYPLILVIVLVVSFAV